MTARTPEQPMANCPAINTDSPRDWQAEALHWRRTAEQFERVVRLGSFELNLDSGALTWSDGTYVIFGLQPGSPITVERALGFYDADARDEISRHIEAAQSSGQPYDVTIPFRSATGEVGWARTIGQIELSGGVRRLVGVIRDITREREIENHLRLQANQDVLTGLPNRRAFLSHLDRALNGRGSEPVALCIVDVDRFKTINDTHGHAVGDELLRETARRLQRSVRTTDFVARLGGDEFVVVLHGMRSRADLRRRATVIVTTARRPLRVGDVDLAPSVSVGACLGVAEDSSPDTLLGGADTALYETKAASRDGFSIFGSRRRRHLGITAVGPSKPAMVLVPLAS